MAVCATGCGTNPIGDYASCDVTVRKGGADRLFFYNCELVVVQGTPGAGEFDITDPAAWETFIGTGELAISPRVTLEKGSASANEIQVSSKNRFFVNNAENTMTVQCFAGDLTAQTDYAFWNDKFSLVNQGKLRVGYISCENDVYTLPDSLGVALSDVRELDANTGSTYFESIFKYDTDGTLIVPIKVAGLVDTLAQV